MTVLRVAAAHRPPFVFIDANRQSRYYGLIVDLLPTLLQTAGLGNVSLDYYSATNSGGVKLANGTWTGIMGELQSGRADIAAFPLTLVPGRPNDIDITYSYISAGVGLLVQKGQVVNDPLLFLQPFDVKLWVALLGAVFAAAVIQKLISLYTPYGDSEILSVAPHEKGGHVEHEHGDHSAAKHFEVEKLSDSILMETWLSLFGERRGMMVGRSWATRIFAIAFAFFSVVIMAAYTANFASLLTVQLVSQNVNSLKDLSVRNATIALNPAGSTTSYFDNTQDPISADVGSRRQYAPDVVTGVEMVRNGSVTAFLTDAPTLQYYAGRVPCDLTVVGNNFGPGALVYGLQKNSSLTAPLNAAMLELYNNGKLDLLRRNWGADIDQCATAATQNSNIQNSALTASQFSGLFAMVGIFAAAAAVWATGEHFAWLLADCHPHIGRAAGTVQRVSKGKDLRRALTRRRRTTLDDSSRESGSLGKAVPLPPAGAHSENPFGHPGQRDIGMVHQGAPRRGEDQGSMEVALMT